MDTQRRRSSEASLGLGMLEWSPSGSRGQYETTGHTRELMGSWELKVLSVVCREEHGEPVSEVTKGLIGHVMESTLCAVRGHQRALDRRWKLLYTVEGWFDRSGENGANGKWTWSNKITQEAVAQRYGNWTAAEGGVCDYIGRSGNILVCFKFPNTDKTWRLMWYGKWKESLIWLLVSALCDWICLHESTGIKN